MIQALVEHPAEREALGGPPLPLTSSQAAGMVDLLRDPTPGRGIR